MRSIRVNNLITCALSFGVLTGSVSAMTLPSRLPAFTKSGDAVDPGFDQWMTQYIDVTPVSEMNNAQVMLWVAGKEPVIRALALIEHKSRAQDALKLNLTSAQTEAAAVSEKEFTAAYTKTISDMPRIIGDELAKKPGDRSAALGDLFLAWKSIDPALSSKDDMERKVFADLGRASCSAAHEKALTQIERGTVARF